MVTDLSGRVKRLDALTHGLALEVSLRKAGADPLLAGLEGAIEGLDAARTVLAKAAERLAGAPELQPAELPTWRPAR